MDVEQACEQAPETMHGEEAHVNKSRQRGRKARGRARNARPRRHVAIVVWPEEESNSRAWTLRLGGTTEQCSRSRSCAGTADRRLWACIPHHVTPFLHAEFREGADGRAGLDGGPTWQINRTLDGWKGDKAETRIARRKRTEQQRTIISVEPSSFTCGAADAKRRVQPCGEGRACRAGRAVYTSRHSRRL